MAERRTRRGRAGWGVLLFLCSPAFLAFLLFFTFKFPAGKNPELYGIYLPRSGALFSLLCLLAGHLSYPRVHNLKIYLLGYLTGLTGLSYFILKGGVLGHDWIASRPDFRDGLYVLIFLNAVAACSLTSSLKYLWTRRLTRFLVIAEAGLIYAWAYHLDLPGWLTYLSSSTVGETHGLFGATGFITVLVLSLLLVKREFYLGGTITGFMLLYTAAWYAPEFLAEPGSFEVAVFLAAPVYLMMGILSHWLMCIQHRGDYDPLLQIFNRNYCDKIISERSKVNTTPPFSVAMVDIDHFKKVNDTYGHQAGDEVLCNTALALTREIAPRGTLCRYGGEEIVAFFPKTRLKDTAKLMDKVRKLVGKLKVKSGRKNIQVTISCGISQRESSSQSIEKVIKAADKALYRAKKKGRNQVRTGKASVR
ncbi:GGDEF domain-containing protein [Fibrobacterota bacterium]